MLVNSFWMGPMRIPLVLAAIPIVLLTGGGMGLAADLEVNRQIYAAPPYYQPEIVSAPFAVWSGCFVGGNGGGAFARWKFNEISPVASAGSQSATAIALGGQIGCDYQVGSWVFGAQGMLDGTGI